MTTLASKKSPVVLDVALLVGLSGIIGCSSVSRTPATGSAPPTTGDSALTEESVQPADAGPSAEPSPDPQQLTEDEILALPPEAGTESDILDIGAMTLEELNASALIEDVLFDYDSAELADEARRTLERSAEWLASHPTVRILIEGHCDERGTVEYNLSLGEERARAARDYLRQLGVGDERMRILSYGKEFPLDPGHTESAWRRNRRAHLAIVAK